MITFVDQLLRSLLVTDVPSLRTAAGPGTPSTTASDQQVRFQPPDDQWRNYVATLNLNAINVYLADVRENRKLRSNERFRSERGDVAVDEPAPVRLDCHYLVSAQSAATVTPQVEPTLDEHAILYEVAGALIRAGVLKASAIYPPGMLFLVPPELRDLEFPMTVAPPEGFPNLAFFWGAMGAQHRWKPVVHVVVTVPVQLATESPGPLVRTRIIEYHRVDDGTLVERTYAIGGTVHLTSGTPAPAWIDVLLVSSSGETLQRTRADADGRFTFAALVEGDYRLVANTSDGRSVETAITVDPRSVGYDLTL